jgi:hypothetical protein
MAISTYPTATEPVIGANDPMFGNTWDQVNIDVENALETEHTNAGEHGDIDVASGGRCICEIGTYTGTGSDGENISLTESNLTIFFLKIFTFSVSNIEVIRTIDMTGDNTKLLSNAVFAANLIQSIGTGTFQVGDGSDVNTLDQKYYYIAYGTMNAFPADSSNFAPTWIEHNEAIDTTLQQRVPAAILSRYRYGHNDDGTHKGQLTKIATGTYTGNGSADGPEVTPTPSLTIKKLIVFNGSAYGPTVKLDTMSGDYSKGYASGYSNWQDNTIRFDTTTSFKIVTGSAYMNENTTTHYYVALGI